MQRKSLIKSMKNYNSHTKNVLVTQTKLNAESDEFDIIHAPLIRIQPLSIDEDFLDAHYDWVILTSKNAVNLFLPYLAKTRYTKIASIGEKTTELLVKHGYHVDFEPGVYTQEGFIEEFPIDEVDIRRVLYPTSRDARNILHDYLEEYGVEVVKFSIYQPVDNIESIQLIKEKWEDINIITFSSPSGVKVLKKYIEPNALKDKPIVSIGAVTKKELDRLGITSKSPEKATLESIFEFIKEKYEV